MKILQLCFFKNQWGQEHQVESHDIKYGKDILNLDDEYGCNFDLIISAPPCDQFTKANALNWEERPENYIKIAMKCYNMSVKSNKLWILENPPGRIEKFIPGLKQYRITTWHGELTNKEYVLYSNILIMTKPTMRYGKTNIKRSKTTRELWQPDLVEDLRSIICEIRL